MENNWEWFIFGIRNGKHFLAECKDVPRDLLSLESWSSLPDKFTLRRKLAVTTAPNELRTGYVPQVEKQLDCMEDDCFFIIPKEIVASISNPGNDLIELAKKAWTNARIARVK